MLFCVLNTYLTSLCLCIYIYTGFILVYCIVYKLFGCGKRLRKIIGIEVVDV